MIIADQILSFISDKMNEKNRYYVLAGVLVIIFLIDYFVIMMPQIRTLAVLNPKIVALSKDLRQARNDIKKINHYQNDVARLRNKMKTIGTTILSKEEVPAILENISLIANPFKIKLYQTMPLKEYQQLVLTNDEGQYYSFPILVNARGGYHNLGRFFNRLENDKIFMNIIDFDITSNSEDPMNHLVNIKIKVFIRDKSENKENK